jgi:hypothetical protein
MLGKIVIVIAALSITGCSASAQGEGFWAEVVREIQRDPRDAPWDPPAGRQLFEQLPAWDNAAERICCGALLGDPAAYRAARCDTAQPIAPRSNRC